MPNVKEGNKKCGSFEILLAKILFFDNYFCVIELCLCRLNSLSLSLSIHSLVVCQSVYSWRLQLSRCWCWRQLRGSPAACCRVINAALRSSLRSLIYLLNCYAYISPYTHVYINTYWCKAMNCEQTTKKTKKSIANKIHTKEAEEVEEEASKRE